MSHKYLRPYKSFFEDANYKTYKGKSRFDFFNKKLFNNEIPSDYKIIFKDLNNSFIGAQTDGLNRRILFNKNNFPHEVLDILLIHEMIHALLVEREGIEEHHKSPHGESFLKERKRIMTKFPEYPIPIKEDLSSIMEVLDKLGIE